MTLSEKQRLFTKLIGQLIEFAYANGYELTFGDCYRSPEQAALLAAQGKGISRSLHSRRLAVDLNLWIDGKYRTDSEAHRPLGEYFVSLHPDCRWGGEWGDGNHYSMEHEGIK